jgi:hypothetical protein
LICLAAHMAAFVLRALVPMTGSGAAGRIPGPDRLMRCT